MDGPSRWLIENLDVLPNGRRVLDLFLGFRSERTARGGEDKALYFAPLLAAQALVNGVVLAVHGQDLGTGAFRRGCH